MKNKQSSMRFLNAVILSVVLLTAAIAMPENVYAQVPVGATPDRISISVKESDIGELYEILSRQNNVNILLASGITEVVTLNLYEVTVQEAIYAIAAAADLAVERINNGYLITKPEKAGKSISEGLTSVKTFKIQYSDITKIAEIIKNQLSQYGKVDILEDRNILVVQDKIDFVNKISALLTKLDQAPAQILIEARILKIDLSEEFEYGVDWGKTFTGGGGTGYVGTESLGEGVRDLSIGAFGGPGGLFFNYVNKNIEAQLNFLSKRGRVHTLAAPSLLALEHQEAGVIVGGRTGYRVTTTINQVTTESIQFLSSGVILKVTPYIDQQGRIMMEIHPEVSSANVNSDGIPSLQTTEVNTRLLVDDGQMVFIGGLIDNNVTDGYQGVPFLEDIPLLGYLFAKDTWSTVSKETIVLLKPQIIQPENMHLITHHNDTNTEFLGKSQEKAEQVNEFFDQRKLHNLE